MAELIQLRTGRADSRRIALLDLGLRPFFLGAGLCAGLALPWWLAVYLGYLTPVTGWPPMLQHAHEMVFGFGAAAVAGFLLTATPNWTKTRPVQGLPLAALAGLWLLGRVAFYVPGLPPAALATVDVAFLPALALTLLPALRQGKRKNFAFEAWLVVLALANLACHLEVLGLVGGLFGPAMRAGVYGLVMLVVILAGRVIPGFTGNALRLAGQAHATHTHPGVELAAKATALAALAADTLGLPAPLTGALAAAAALLLLLRMRGWRSLQTLGQPIVWILHAGHLWLVVAMGCLAASHLGTSVPSTLALHAFTAGVIGTMVLAIMTRASLGHTGRPLRVHGAITAAYVLVTVGALARVFGPLLAAPHGRTAIALGGSAWAVGYLLFSWVYAPILLGPRADGVRAE